MRSSRLLENGRRILFVLFGVALIGIGIGSEGGTGGLLLALVGLVPLSSGLFGWCPSVRRDRNDDSASDGFDEDGPG